MRISDYLCDQLSAIGLKQVFMLTGGGAMHLNDAFARAGHFHITCLHHEQSMGMAAEGYTRTCGLPAIVNVTTGPGGINVLNGVFGAFVDSVKMIVISGQVKTETIAHFNDKTLRQLGDQEADIFAMASPIVKYITLPKNANEAIIAIEEAINYLNTGRDGPVWIDIPIDVQSAKIDSKIISNALTDRDAKKSLLKKIHPNVEANVCSPYSDLSNALDEIIDLFEKAERPLVMVGNGVRLSDKVDCFSSIIEKLSIPFVTGWNAHDILPTTHPLFVGKPGTVGDRAGNFSTHNADFILILGCRMNIRQISYNWQSFGKSAKIAMVDIDITEINKPTLSPDVKIHLPLETFLPALQLRLRNWKVKEKHAKFLVWCRSRLATYPVITADKFNDESGINPYAFFSVLYKHSNAGDVIVLANGTACVVGHQSTLTNHTVRIFTNSGCASMGYDIPASIGAALAIKEKQRVICVAGDGSIMQNIQELAVIAQRSLPIKIFILENDGYHSIRQTQRNYFPENEVGTNNDDGLSIPDFEKILPAFGIHAENIADLDALAEVFESEMFKSNVPSAYIIRVDQSQNFEPKLQSRINKDGSMQSPELHDMYPFLGRKEFEKNIFQIFKKD